MEISGWVKKWDHLYARARVVVSNLPESAWLVKNQGKKKIKRYFYPSLQKENQPRIPTRVYLKGPVWFLTLLQWVVVLAGYQTRFPEPDSWFFDYSIKWYICIIIGWKIHGRIRTNALHPPESPPLWRILEMIFYLIIGISAAWTFRIRIRYTGLVEFFIIKIPWKTHLR